MGVISKNMKWAREIFDNRPLYKTPKSETILRKFQIDIKEILNSQNDRNILWLFDEGGEEGKSFLVTYLLDHYDAFVSNGGKFNDIAYTYDYQEIVCFDLPRGLEPDSDRMIPVYKAMECFKDGRISSNKYQSILKRFKPCKVLVTSNYLPNIDKMSKDRWEIYNVENGKLTKIHWRDVRDY